MNEAPGRWTRFGDSIVLGVFGMALRVAVTLLRWFRKA